MVTEGDKSVTQQLSDSTSTKPGEKGYVAQAQDMASGAAKYVQDTATSKSSSFHPHKGTLSNCLEHC